MATDAERITALANFYDNTSDSLPTWLNAHVDHQTNCPIVSIGTGTNAQKTANILNYERANLNPWEATNIVSPAPKPQYNGKDLTNAVAIGTFVRVYWSGGNADRTVTQALDIAEAFGYGNDTYIKTNVDFPQGENPPIPPGGGGG
jgi:hypothetical protein